MNINDICIYMAIVQFTSETKVLDKRNFQVGEVCDVLSGDVMPTGSRVMSYDNSCGAKLFSYWVLFQFLSLPLSLFGVEIPSC